MHPSLRSVVSFSALVSPAGGVLMGAFKGYVDESGDDGAKHNALAFCGYVAPVDYWKVFEKKWASALADNQAPYLHMKELMNPAGLLSRFAGRENQELRAKLLGDLVAVIKESGLTCVGSLIRLPDLREFNAEKSLNLAPLPLAMYGTMAELSRLFVDDTIELVIDRMDKPEQVIAEAIEYASSYLFHNVSQNISLQPLKGENSFRNVLPIQAADFVAWEARKEHERKNDWWKSNKRGVGASDWVSDTAEWLASQGKTWPDHRKSFAGLTKAAKIHAVILDYDALCSLHERRQHIWSREDRRRHWFGSSGEQSS